MNVIFLRLKNLSEQKKNPANFNYNLSLSNIVKNFRILNQYSYMTIKFLILKNLNFCIGHYQQKQFFSMETNNLYSQNLQLYSQVNEWKYSSFCNGHLPSYFHFQCSDLRLYTKFFGNRKRHYVWSIFPNHGLGK